MKVVVYAQVVHQPWKPHFYAKLFVALSVLSIMAYPKHFQLNSSNLEGECLLCSPQKLPISIIQYSKSSQTYLKKHPCKPFWNWKRASHWAKEYPESVARENGIHLFKTKASDKCNCKHGCGRALAFEYCWKAILMLSDGRSYRTLNVSFNFVPELSIGGNGFLILLNTSSYTESLPAQQICGHRRGDMVTFASHCICKLQKDLKPKCTFAIVPTLKVAKVAVWSFFVVK